MSKIFKIGIVSILLLITFNNFAKANDIPTINQLIENGKSFDKKHINIQGEVIGDLMKRGQYTWINITDGTPMGIWVKSEEASKVITLGNYNHKGDVIEVTGTFNRACSEHGGDMDIHADSIKIIKNGSVIQQPIDYNKKSASIILSIITIALISIYLHKKSNNEFEH